MWNTSNFKKQIETLKRENAELQHQLYHIVPGRASSEIFKGDFFSLFKREKDGREIATLTIFPGCWPDIDWRHQTAVELKIEQIVFDRGSITLRGLGGKDYVRLQHDLKPGCSPFEFCLDFCLCYSIGGDGTKVLNCVARLVRQFKKIVQLLQAEAMHYFDHFEEIGLL